MFEASVTKFTQSVGEGSLQPSPNLDQSVNCKLFHVVVKKYRKWPWQSAVYEPCPFSLSQLITEQDKPLEDVIKPIEAKALEYNKTHKLNVNGKIGAQIKAILDVELDGSDSIDVESKFGDVNKMSIDETVLMTELLSRHLNTDHEYVKQVRQHPRKVLCIIVSAYTLASGGTVAAQKSISGEEKVEEDKLPKVVVGGDEDLKVSDSNSKTIVLMKDTVIAYRELEIRVAHDRSLHLILTKDLRGSFDDVDSVDGAFSSASVTDHPLQLFKPLLEMEAAKRQDLNKAILHMCNYPKDIDTFLVLMKKASALCKETEATEMNIKKDTQLTVLKEKFLCPDFDWATILQIAGFNFIADGTVEYPQPGALYLDPVICIYKGLIELDDDQLIFCADLQKPMGKPIIYLLSQTINKKSVTTKDKEFESLFEHHNAALDFISALDYNVTTEGSITPPSGNSHQLHGASCALYGLFWELSYNTHSKHWCTLL